MVPVTSSSSAVAPNILSADLIARHKTFNVESQFDIEECNDFSLSLTDVDISLTRTELGDVNLVGSVRGRELRQLLLEIIFCPTLAILAGPMPNQCSQYTITLTTHTNC